MSESKGAKGQPPAQEQTGVETLKSKVRFLEEKVTRLQDENKKLKLASRRLYS